MSARRLGALGSVIARRLLPLLVALPAAAILPLVALSRRRRPSGLPRLVWGPVPIINNRYWSQAMQRLGYQSTTLMEGYYDRINRREDFDRYTIDFCPFRRPTLQRLWELTVGPYVVFARVLGQADIFHHPFSGGFLGQTPLWRFEAWLLHLARKAVVVIPYGADAFVYSRVQDPSVRHALLLSYPAAARHEAAILRRIAYWARHGDIVVPGSMIDAMPRWDVLVFNPLVIDTDLWRPRSSYSPADGRIGPVRVVHTPNHRGFKGTEFLVRAVEDLRREGLQVELLLLEGLQNKDVRRTMAERADILVEQLIFTGYAMSALEGMATGVPVLANLEDNHYTRVFRRYSFLDACPIVSTTPETVREQLRRLVTQPDLREEIGRACRRYVERYHSFAFAQDLFGHIYRRLAGEPVDLLKLYQPLSQSDRVPPVLASGTS